MNNNYIYTHFLSCSENEKIARQIIAHFVSNLNPTLDELCDIKTAVSEAVTNSVVHGYKNKKGIIFMTAESFKNELTIIVEDRGVGIKDVEQARQPLFTTEPELERSGMGFTVMETFMDELEIFSNPGCGTKIIMRKRIGTND